MISFEDLQSGMMMRDYTVTRKLNKKRFYSFVVPITWVVLCLTLDLVVGFDGWLFTFGVIIPAPIIIIVGGVVALVKENKEAIVNWFTVENRELR